MYFWTAYLNGKTLIQIYKRLEDVLYETWLNSVYVWGPVQVIQQGLIPLQYRVAFANFVSYFWDTYLSYMMMADGKAEIILTQTEVLTQTEEETRRSIKKEGNNQSKELQKEKLKDKTEKKGTLVINHKRPIIDSDYKRKRDASTPAISRTLSQRRLTRRKESLENNKDWSINEQDFELKNHLKENKKK